MGKAGVEPEVHMVTPKFLTKELAALAVESVMKAVMDRHVNERVNLMLKRQSCHIVILVPSMKDDRQADYPDWPNYHIEPSCLYEYSEGRKDQWSAKYDDIARCKALQLWHDRNDDRTDIMPHLLFPGDTPFWGGVKRHGIVVTCSGVQPYFDKMISGMVADMLIGLAYHAWMMSNDKAEDVDFLR